MSGPSSDPNAPLLIEIGCEEIPARMIPGAAAELARRIESLLERAALSRGAASAWGGSRRLAVRIEAVQQRQADRDETVVGPPVQAAFDASGAPTRAAQGFAAKQGIDPSLLQPIETERGVYAGFRRVAPGLDVGEVLARDLPAAVATMPFPKTMRWADGALRWVRPVHWVVALHGSRALAVELLGVRSGSHSAGHRFLARGAVAIEHPDLYAGALEAAFVLADPVARRQRLAHGLDVAAREIGGVPVADPDLLEEVVDLVEWPGVFAGRFDAGFLDLPRELLVTTLRHHQKCFSVQDTAGALMPAFLAVANTDRDPGGHVQRGNEWVVGGRLEDARFFWREDRAKPLAPRSAALAGVTYHARAGSYLDKARRMTAIAVRLAERLNLEPDVAGACREAAELAKNDLVTGTVGEFPELQGQIGGLLLRAEGYDSRVARAVYDHYRPAGVDDRLPDGVEACVVSASDKLDAVVSLLAAGERPSGSKDPLGLRRACNGLLRVVLDSGWPLTLDDLAAIGEAGPPALAMLRERFEALLRDRGYSTNEIRAVTRPRIDAIEANARSLGDLLARLDSIRKVRGREDFTRLVKLTERVDNILTKNAQWVDDAHAAGPEHDYVESAEASRQLERMAEQAGPSMALAADRRSYDEIVETLATFIDPVERFFTDCLVIDDADAPATRHRIRLLSRIGEQLTLYFDIRELAGEAERRI